MRYIVCNFILVKFGYVISYLILCIFNIVLCQINIRKMYLYFGSFTNKNFFFVDQTLPSIIINGDGKYYNSNTMIITHILTMFIIIILVYLLLILLPKLISYIYTLR